MSIVQVLFIKGIQTGTINLDYQLYYYENALSAKLLLYEINGDFKIYLQIRKSSSFYQNDAYQNKEIVKLFAPTL